MVKIIAVVGRMRTGTTVLRQMIGSTERSFDLGEVFHGDTSLNTNFWGFLNNICLIRPEFRHPAAIGEAWNLFIQDQQKKQGREIFIIDAKMEYFPYIIRTDLSNNWFFFDSESVKYILLQRRNILAQSLSRLWALHTNSWARVSSDAPPEKIANLYHVRGRDRPFSDHDPLVEVDVDGLYSEVSNISCANNKLEASDIYRRFDLHLFYEDLFGENEHFRDDILRSVSKICEIEHASFDSSPILKRQRMGGVLSKLSNPEAVIERFSGTPFAWMLEI